MERLGRFFIDRPAWVLGLVLAALAGLPLALWQDMDALSDNHMERQTQSMNAILSAVRAYYAENPEAFTAPEVRQLSYAWLTPDMIQDEVTVDETALRALYEERLADFVQPERSK